MNHDSAMQEAIREARKALGKTHPNPAVGAIITSRGEVVARGHTQEAGSHHAEVMTLKAFAETGLSPEEACLYVTLEPCSTTGRTPPCTRAIQNSGIKNVVIGALDPNPAHQGNAIPLLEGAGIKVTAGVKAADCEDLNLIFNTWISRRTPLIAAKIATTLDGFIATRKNRSKWITGEEARADVMRWRRYFPAIAVGANTVLHDNPSLTARLDGETWCPVRFIFDRHLITLQKELPQVFTDSWRERTILITAPEKKESISQYQEKFGFQAWFIEDTSEANLAFRNHCHEESITGVMIEGGSSLLSSFLKSDQLDYLIAYRAPKILGDPDALNPFTGFAPDEIGEGFELSHLRQNSFGQDQLIRGFLPKHAPSNFSQ